MEKDFNESTNMLDDVKNTQSLMTQAILRFPWKNMELVAFIVFNYKLLGH